MKRIMYIKTIFGVLLLLFGLRELMIFKELYLIYQRLNSPNLHIFTGKILYFPIFEFVFSILLVLFGLG
jgi:hypothetical protein